MRLNLEKEKNAVIVRSIKVPQVHIIIPQCTNESTSFKFSQERFGLKYVGSQERNRDWKTQVLVMARHVTHLIV